MPGVLPLATGAGHMLYRPIVLLHSLLVTLFPEPPEQANQKNACKEEDSGDIQVSSCVSFPF